MGFNSGFKGLNSAGIRFKWGLDVS